MDHESRDDCPHCGVEPPDQATFCRACGASGDSGWGNQENSEEWATGGYGEDEEFDYDEFVRNEFPQEATSRGGWRMSQIVAALLLLLGLGLVAGLLF